MLVNQLTILIEVVITNLEHAAISKSFSNNISKREPLFVISYNLSVVTYVVEVTIILNQSTQTSTK